MCPQNICPRGCKVTLVAFVWLFSTVCCQMSPQIAYPRRCIVTLVAFVGLFPTVHFQMCPQMACSRRSNCLPERMQSHIGCIYLTFLHCAFSNVSSKRPSERLHNHTGYICLIFPCVHWQLFHWNSSPGNYHDHGFVPSPQGGKVCPLLLLVLNWEHSNVKLPRKRKWKWN